MNTLEVKLKDRSYPIYIGADLLTAPDLFAPHVDNRQVLVVTNETIAPLYLEKVTSLLQQQLCNVNDCKSLVLPDGESYKNMQTLNLVFDALLEARFSRQCVLVALGGGVIGDITGFAAASYQRGVNFIQVPTTLLAQVDSSVGGKTGVNHALGKNMIGAFHQPVAVVSDTSTMDTLDDRQLIAGIAEVIKYGLINDATFFSWLEQNIENLLRRDKDALCYVIERSCANKADVVERDELETNVRAILNLGHTFGHAIETLTGYTQWLHGEAVAVGMLMAAEMSMRMGKLTSDDVLRVKSLLKKAKLPVSIPGDLSLQDMVKAMGVDKKVMDKKIRLVLLDGIGSAYVTAEFEKKAMLDSIEACQD